QIVLALLLNTTSVGMSPNIDAKPISLEKLKEDALVSDLIYNPLETALLKEAKQRGGKTQNGVGMFVGQGALAFKKWTGVEPNRLRMKDIVIKQLGV
ncbi:MAG TPA: shikimate dehydrogenase, partial [Bacilli bacterium]|nr:shikimate dehydrogenase [Bacilli bacterium]